LVGKITKDIRSHLQRYLDEGKRCNIGIGMLITDKVGLVELDVGTSTVTVSIGVGLWLISSITSAANLHRII